jgi:hypothetical protein
MSMPSYDGTLLLLPCVCVTLPPGVLSLDRWEEQTTPAPRTCWCLGPLSPTAPYPNLPPHPPAGLPHLQGVEPPGGVAGSWGKADHLPEWSSCLGGLQCWGGCMYRSAAAAAVWGGGGVSTKRSRGLPAWLPTFNFNTLSLRSFQRAKKITSLILRSRLTIITTQL